jgi:DNA-directed RNA polymerase subunit RPC12/RpoP
MPQVLLAVLFGLAIFWLGMKTLRGLARPMPVPPPAGEMRKVNLRYRCSLCGAEVRMTLSPDEDPDPPRHCQEEMTVVAPIE